MQSLLCLTPLGTFCLSPPFFEKRFAAYPIANWHVFFRRDFAARQQCLSPHSLLFLGPIFCHRRFFSLGLSFLPLFHFAPETWSPHPTKFPLCPFLLWSLFGSFLRAQSLSPRLPSRIPTIFSTQSTMRCILKFLSLFYPASAVPSLALF